MLEFKEVETSILMLGEQTPVDTVLETLQKVTFMQETIRRFRDDVEAKLVAWIKANGDITCGDIRYYVGTPKDTKCKSLRETLETLLEVTGGDMDRIVQCLSSNAWKYGAIRSLLEEFGAPDQFERLFEVTEREELKEGKPTKVKKLIKADSRFVA